MKGRSRALAAAGFDAVAVKPTKADPRRVARRFEGTVVLDFEGVDHLPDPGTIETIGADRGVVTTLPVRVDGFDPLGDDRLLDTYAAIARPAFVAGNAAYLEAHERRRGVAQRLRVALDRHPTAWVGTEGIERVALSTGATQYELLSSRTAREMRAMRAAGFTGDIVVYAPTVLSEDDDVALDALGGYVARRRPVAERLPAGADTDAEATGRTREILVSAIDDYAVVGSAAEVADRLATLRKAGVTTVVGYPAGGRGST